MSLGLFCWCTVKYSLWKYFKLLLMKYSEGGKQAEARMFPECKYDRKPSPLPSHPQSAPVWGLETQFILARLQADTNNLSLEHYEPNNTSKCK